jgi:hypothetical protein
LVSHTSTERDEALDAPSERDEQFQALLQALLPEVRRRHAGYTDERLFETAIHLAAYRMWVDAGTEPGPDGAA